jgi:hypothetical protein
MATMTVPTDPRPQFSFADLAVASHSLGLRGMPPTEQIGPDRYILAGYWPQTPTRNSFPSRGPVVETPQPEVTSRSSASARAVWPNLR